VVTRDNDEHSLEGVDFDALLAVLSGDDTPPGTAATAAAVFDRVVRYCAAKGWTVDELAHTITTTQGRRTAKVFATTAAAPDRDAALQTLLEGRPELLRQLISALRFIQVITTICPAPIGQATGNPGGEEPAIYAKVRALLAKAESTEFPAEAEALTEKAQTLIARYAIDLARLEAERPANPNDISARRILIHQPYARAKFVLLDEIAGANRAQCVFHPGFLAATIFGSEPDLAGVDVLFTSLLAQAAQAMVAAGTSPHTRSRGFRHAFMLSYAHRIGERLHHATVMAMRDAPSDLLPVLRGRVERVRGTVEAAFPRLRPMHTTAGDGEGWYAGRVAADRASLGTRPRLDP